MKIKLIAICILLILIMGCQKKNAPKVEENKKFNIEKYLGRWYEIKRYDHKFERGLTEVQANYTYISPNRVEVLNTGVDKAGVKKEFKAVAKVQNAPNFLKVYPKIFPLVGGEYNVAWVDEEYKYAIVTSGSYNYLWFLSREKTIPLEVYDEMIKFVEKLGYDVTKLIDGQKKI